MTRRRSGPVPVPDSLRGAPEGAERVGELDPEEPLALTVHFRRRSPAPRTGGAADLARFNRQRSRSALDNERRRTHAAAAHRVQAFFEASDVAVRDVDFTSRKMTIEAPARVLTGLFHAEVALYRADGDAFLARTGTLQAPRAIAPWTRAIVGFDQRPLPPRPALVGGDPAGALWPTEVAALYGVPLDRDVSKVCVGIIALRGAYRRGDLDAALTRMQRDAPEIVEIDVDGQRVNFGVYARGDQELALDLQILAALLPHARIVLYFAANSQDGIGQALDKAIHDPVNRPSVISLSWGVTEVYWTEPRREVVNAALADAMRYRVTVVAASGDRLATCGEPDGRAHVWFPASSPMVLSCGGTAFDLAGGAIAAERVWKDGAVGGGGGVSDYFDVADFQTGAGIPPSVNDGLRRGRGVPDVAALASEAPGYRIVYNDAEVAMGGTSAGTPLWAGILAIAKAASGNAFGLVNPKLYAQAALFRQITQGDNMVGRVGYEAHRGWNACAGLGVPLGAAIVGALAQ